jgi:SRSO17 transposase
MLGENKKDLAGLISDPKGMITGDGCDFPKKGDMPAGVARQCCGRLGRIENCQAGVFIGRSGRSGSGLVDFELLTPEKWFGDDFKAKRVKCRIPEDLSSGRKERSSSP